MANVEDPDARDPSYKVIGGPGGKASSFVKNRMGKVEVIGADQGDPVERSIEEPR